MNFIVDNPEGIKSADIVVGLPSYNEAPSISFTARQADKGLHKHFSGRSSVIVNCDNNSPDNTRQAFMQTVTKAPKMYVSTEGDVRGKGNNLRCLFTKALELNAKAVVIVDADVKSITPLWIRNLGEPLFDDYQFVAPLYVRHKYDGTLTSNMTYPLTRALYGRRVRQPISGDVGLSGDLVRTFMEGDAWDDAVANFGINIWMTTTAVQSRVSVIQAFMGKPRIHEVRNSPTEMDAMFKDVVGTLFELMCRYDHFWKDVRWSRPTAVYGFGVGDLEVPPPVEVDTGRVMEKLRSGLTKYWDLYSAICHADNINKLGEVADFPEEGFEFPTVLWSKILYDFSVAYRDKVVPRDDLLGALLPLYYAKTLSFVLETQAMNNQQVEEFIEDQCLHFEKTKPYLVERWFSR